MVMQVTWWSLQNEFTAEPEPGCQPYFHPNTGLHVEGKGLPGGTQETMHPWAPVALSRPEDHSPLLHVYLEILHFCPASVASAITHRPPFHHDLGWLWAVCLVWHRWQLSEDAYLLPCSDHQRAARASLHLLGRPRSPLLHLLSKPSVLWDPSHLPHNPWSLSDHLRPKWSLPPLKHRNYYFPSHSFSTYHMLLCIVCLVSFI